MIVFASLVMSLCCVGLLACDMRACTAEQTDEDRRAAEWEQMRSNPRVMAARRRIMADNDRRRDAVIKVRAAFARKYAERVQPGVGCDVCPDLCTATDLRPLSTEQWLEQFRRSSTRFREAPDHRTLLFEDFELSRLSCIAQAGKAGELAGLQAALGPAEHRTVRWNAAVIAVNHGLLTEPGWRAIRELARGSDAIAEEAQFVLERPDDIIPLQW